MRNNRSAPPRPEASGDRPSVPCDHPPPPTPTQSPLSPAPARHLNYLYALPSIYSPLRPNSPSSSSISIGIGASTAACFMISPAPVPAVPMASKRILKELKDPVQEDPIFLQRR
ncbi:hypothetical protein ZWY2020_002983 [Hordeum vulgare]|nr:hypothetical protein ZWY2020_002983 [Hordeum vulgare]